MRRESTRFYLRLADLKSENRNLNYQVKLHHRFNEKSHLHQSSQLTCVFEVVDLFYQVKIGQSIHDNEVLSNLSSKV